MVVHAPAEAAAAREIARLLSGSPLCAPLAAPLSESYAMRVTNRYYTADLAIALAPDTAAAADSAAATTCVAPPPAALLALAQECGALILLYDLADPSSFERLKSKWSGQFADGAPEILLVVGTGRDGAADNNEAASAARWEWCFDAGAELVDVDFAADGAAALEAGAAMREGRRPPADNGEAEGLSRVLEALQCRVWPSAPAAAPAPAPAPLELPAPTPARRHPRRRRRRRPRPRRRATLLEAERQLRALAEAAEGMEEAAGGVRLTAEEEQHERLEKLMATMSHLREKGDALDPEERRERASRAALEMASLLGDDFGDDSDDGANPDNI